MKLEDLTKDQLRILGGGLPLGPFDTADCKLDDPTDSGIENSCTQLVDEGFLIYNGREETERFPVGCFETTQQGWELFLRFREWKLGKISLEDKVKYEGSWSHFAEKTVSAIYEREKLKKQLKQEHNKINKINERLKRRDEEIEQTWQNIRTLWNQSTFQAKLMIFLFFSPILFVIWMFFRLLVGIIVQ